MTGRLLAIFLLLSAALAGGALYYLQVYGYYSDVVPEPGREVLLVPLGDTEPEPIEVSDFRAIDSESSPIRYRACFSTMLDLVGFTSNYRPVEDAVPRNAPGWFDCFDAEAIGQGIASGDVRVFLGQKNIAFGVDRLVAIAPDGSGHVWHELNECGKKAYDGTVVGEECPPLPASAPE